MRHPRQGFTLIELSIVLVVIGLLVGGVLVGRDLIKAAEVRATITQIDKYNTAANTFRDKYGGLPGDLTANAARLFGFTPRMQLPGLGDGNGFIEGYRNGPFNAGLITAFGETAIFWVDLSQSHLIDGGFNTASNVQPGSDITGAAIAFYMPQARLGQGNFIYVYSGGVFVNPPGQWLPEGYNYFALDVVSNIAQTSGLGGVISTPGLTVQQTYAIDRKADDGFPQSGNITARYTNFSLAQYTTVWAAGGGIAGAAPGVAATPSASTCYDNSGSATNAMVYSITQNGGANVNCALSFRFQ